MLTRTRAATLLLTLMCGLPLFGASIGFDGGTIAPGGSPLWPETLPRGLLLGAVFGWSVVVLALVTSVGAFVQNVARRDPVLTFMGIVLAAAAVLEAMRVLASYSTGATTEQAAYLWFLTRLATAILLLTGVVLCSFALRGPSTRQGPLHGTFAAFAVIVVAVVVSLGQEATSLGSRSADVGFQPGAAAPIVVLVCAIILCSTSLIPLRRHVFAESVRSFAVLLVMPQLYAMFGWRALGPSVETTANAVLVVAFSAPLIGLLVHQLSAYREQAHLADSLHSQAFEMGGEMCELRDAKRRLAMSDRVARALNERWGDRPFESALDAFRREIKCLVIALYVRDANSVITCQAAVTPDETLTDTGLLSAEGLPTSVITSGRSQLVDGAGGTIRVRYGIGEAPVEAVGGWPILVDGEAVAALVIGHALSPRRPSSSSSTTSWSFWPRGSHDISRPGTDRLRSSFSSSERSSWPTRSNGRRPPRW